MTIGEGIAKGGSAYLERQEKARQFDASLREKAREADQQAAVSLANAPRDHTSERLSEERRQFDANLAERKRQFDESNEWNDALNQQRIETLKSQQEENAARMAHYQQLEEQTRRQAADLKEERTSTMKGLYWLSRRNGGMTVSPEVLADFTKNMKANDLVAIKTAGFFYNEDGTVKSPQNDDNKDPLFGISYNYVDPNTGKIAMTPDGSGYAEKVMVPKFQKDWIGEGDIFSSLYSTGKTTFNQRMAIANENNKTRKEIAFVNLEYKKALDESLKQMKLDAEQDKQFRSIFGAITRQNGAVGAKFTPQEAVEQTKAIMSDMGHKISEGQAEPEKKDNEGDDTKPEVQSKDKPVAPPNGKQTDEHNGKKYTWGWSDKLNKWMYIPEAK